MVESVGPSPKEHLIRRIAGAAREFFGNAVEGKRADALNHATGYAYAAGVNIDSLPKDEQHRMRHDGMVSFLSANDFNLQVTRIIYATKDKNKLMAGDGYITRLEEDIAPRTQRVKKLAEGNSVIDDTTDVFEMNFDAPWHHGDAYVNILSDGMYDMLGEFFSHNPDAAVYMYVEGDDIPSDGLVLSRLGAKNIGTDIYMNEPEPDEMTPDTVFIINRDLFTQSSRYQERNT